MTSPRPILISVHLPKTAGTSFQDSLRAAYGDRLQLRYKERPLHRSPGERQRRVIRGALQHALFGLRDDSVDCIHGHFLPASYARIRGRSPVRYVTWFRDPVERLVSHYHYWLRSYNGAQAGALHRQVVEENWSLEAFVFAPALRDLYSAFLWRFPLERFDFIGITEHYSDDLAYFSEHFLEQTVPEVRHNASPQGDENSTAIDGELRRRIERFHSKDMSLYHRALELRAARSGA